MQGIYPSSTTAGSSVAQCFTANATCYLYNVTFSLYKVGLPTGLIAATLREIGGGTVGTTAFPSMTVIETSTSLNASTLAGTSADYTFTFLGSSELTVNSTYAITLDAVSGYFSTSNRVVVDETNTAAGNAAAYYSSAWFAQSSRDVIMVVNADTTGTGATPTPTPAPTSSGSGDADMEALTAAILPFLVPLLVCLIPALLGYKFVGELGFFIGLNVGVILAYVTLGGTAYAFPLWGIILVGVMDVAVVLMRR